MYTSICWYLRVLPVLHIPEVVDIDVKSYIEKHAICLKDYRIRSFLSIQYAHGDPDPWRSRSVLESIPKCLHKSPCACLILKNGLILYFFRHMACFSK